MQQAVLAPPQQATKKALPGCTAHRQKVRFHILYDDFEDICNGDVRLAHALRLCETQSDRRIVQLRASHDIPEGYLPSDEDLWFAMSYRQAEALTLHAVSKSTCERIFGEAEECDGGMPSLIDLGFLCRRYAARPGYGLVTRPEHATIYRDADGDFIVVDDCGEYVGNDDRRYSALADGYTRIERQYLYCFDVVNAAIAEFDGLDAPEALPRWEAMIARWEPGGRRKRQKKSAVAAQETTITQTANTDAKEKDERPRKGTNQSVNSDPFKKQNITESGHMSRFDDNITPVALRAAQWCTETLLALSAQVLAVPPAPNEDDEEALALWERDWGEPARRLYAATITLSPQLAWQRVDLTTRYMATPGSPSWWQREPGDPRGWRKVKSAITLKNVADRFVSEYEDFKHNQWFPANTTPYDGPALEEYGAGYSGTEALVVEELPPVVVESDEAIAEVEELPAEHLEAIAPPDEEAPRQAFPMLPEKLTELAKEIMEEYPEAGLSTLSIAEDKVYLSLALGPDEYFDVDIVIWRVPYPSEEALIVRAMSYGAQCLAAAESLPVEVEAGEAMTDGLV